MQSIANIGCGKLLMDGAINLDIRKLENIDVVGDIRYLPFICMSFDIVYCSDVLEHLSIAEFPAGLSELCRITRKDLFIKTPSMDVLIKLYNEGKIDNSGLTLSMYGAQTYVENYHKCIQFTDYITNAIICNGFYINELSSDCIGNINVHARRNEERC